MIARTPSLYRDLYQLRLALRTLTFGLGIFFLAMSYNKLAWFDDPAQLTQRFQRWLPNAAPYARVYLQTMAIPGGEVFARVVPIAEFLTALSMFTGVLRKYRGRRSAVHDPELSHGDEFVFVAGVLHGCHRVSDVCCANGSGRRRTQASI